MTGTHRLVETTRIVPLVLLGDPVRGSAVIGGNVRASDLLLLDRRLVGLLRLRPLCWHGTMPEVSDRQVKVDQPWGSEEERPDVSVALSCFHQLCADCSVLATRAGPLTRTTLRRETAVHFHSIPTWEAATHHLRQRPHLLIRRNESRLHEELVLAFRVRRRFRREGLKKDYEEKQVSW
jgi:hypothetical protein